MPNRFSIFIVICGLLVVSIWIAVGEKILSHDISADGNVIAITLHVQSLFPPDENITFQDVTVEGLDIARRFPVRFERLSWRGPIWRQSCFLLHTTLIAVPTQTVLIHGHSVTLPEIQPQDTRLPEAPLPLRTPEHESEANVLSALLAFLAFVILTILFVLRLTSLRTPDVCLRRLPATAQSLERIPGLMSRKGITRRTHPEFFMELDRLRFAPSLPSQDEVRDIIHKAQTL